jgi:hypothetical protein
MAVDRMPTPSPTAPPMSARRIASDRNWIRTWPLVAPSARRSPILRAPLEHGDDHDVGDADGADGADEQGYRAEAQEQGVEGTLGVGLGD